MARTRTIVVGALLASALVLSGCKKKKPPIPPPQAQAPTITEPQTQPTESKTEPIPAEPQPTPPATQPTAPPPKVTTKTKPKSKPRVTDKTTAKKTTSAPEKNKTVVDDTNAKADAPQPPLTTDAPNSQAAQQRQQTAQLVQVTEYNLNSIKRPLNNDEQAIVQHIRSFLDQSKQATKDGDTERAYNLAVRARLLSDSLKK